MPNYTFKSASSVSELMSIERTGYLYYGWALVTELNLIERVKLAYVTKS